MGPLLAGITLASLAVADFVKTSGPLPLRMPGTLGLSVARKNLPAMAKRGDAQSCTAFVADIPEVGARIVTAKHCVGEKIEIFDDEHSLLIEEHHDAAGDVDLSWLEAKAPLPFAALELRPSETLSVGERLCAFRIERAFGKLHRQQICGRFSDFVERGEAGALLRVHRPFPRGTSGSPLVDEAGKVVGVVVQSQDEWGLAEPIESAFALTRAPIHPR